MISPNSIKIGKLFGIQVGINYNWFIIFFIMVVSFSGYVRDQFGASQSSSLTFAVLTTLLLFASVLAHEFGHALTARAFGIQTRKIILHLFGGVAFLESEPRRPLHEFLIAIAGPAVSIALAVVFGGLYFLILGHASELIVLLVQLLAGLNLMLGVLNCAPGFPLDGGRVLRAVVWAATGDYLKSTRIAAMGGVAVGLGLILWGVSIVMVSLTGAILRILLGVFVIYLARMSTRQAEVLAAFHGLTVRDIMQPVRAVVPADTPLSDVYAWYFMRLGVDQLPVVRGDVLLGAITLEDIQRIPPRQWDWVQAREAVRPFSAAEMVAPEAEAIQALDRFAGTNRLTVPVFEGRRLLGYITRGDVVKLLQRRRGTAGGPA